MDKDSLWRNGERVLLRDKQLAVLRILVENYGNVVTIKEFKERVWQKKYFGKNAIDQQISALRRVLGESPRDNKYIRTEVGVGFSFVAPVEESADGPNNSAATREVGLKIITATIPIDNSINDVPTEIQAQQSTLEEATSGAVQKAVSGKNEMSLIPGLEIPVVTTAPAYVEPFDNWGLRSGLWITLAIGLAVLLPLGLFISGHDWNDLESPLSLIQAIAISIAFFYIPNGRGSQVSNPDPKIINEVENRQAQIALSQFKLYWRLLLATWCLLYFILFVSKIFPPPLIKISNTLLNNSNSLMLALCYIVLNRPTVINREGRDIEDVPLKKGIYLVGGFGLLEMILVWLGYHRGLLNPHHALFGADLISGIVGSMTMALCISRLHSKLLSPSNWLPIVLYSYVGIQPLYIFLNLDSKGPLIIANQGLYAPWIIQAAFVLKL
ncbi:MAG TPA: winged helix-turn-helix domain-containing protein, partial [Blastocatellia bacterium]